MASQQGRGNSDSQEPYYFFKLILETTIRDGKLISDSPTQEIPSKFASDYGNTLSSPVFFEVPNSQVWELELKKLDGRMWVQNGWPKFADHYSLELGHFLVFRYQGNRRFHVLIFDKSASEIHYPYTDDKDREKIHQQEVKSEESQEDDSLQIIDNMSKGMRKKPVLQCLRPRKMMRTGRYNNEFSSGKGKVKRVNFVEKSQALERASSAFNSENPFFLVLMQPTYVGCFLSIPTEFSRKYLMDHGDVILSVSNGKTWSAEYRSSLGMDKRPYVRLGKGWGAFVHDNNLRVGDVCAFELINRNDITFRVFIYGHGPRSSTDVCLGPLKVHETALQRTMKAREKAHQRELANEKEKFHQEVNIEEDDSVQIKNNIPVKRANSVEKSKALEGASSAFNSENPYFLVLMQPAYVARLHSKVFYLSIPKEFSRKYLMNHGYVVLRDSNGKTWSAEYRSIRVDKRLYVRLGIGWGTFVCDNNLQVGDICVFELINRNNITFRVFIYRSKKADFQGLRTFTDVCLGPLKVHDTALQRIMKAREKALQRTLANYKEKYHQQEVMNIEESEDEDTVQIMNSISKAVREKPVLHCPRPQKMMRAGRHDNECSDVKGKRKRLKPYEKFKAIERACSAFKSENPFFLVLMQPTSVGCLKPTVKCDLSIPVEFSKKYLKRRGDIVLSNSNGKTWSAGYYTFLGTNKRPYVQLCKGWNAFVRDNNLQVGDVCAFELINHDDISLRVSIYGGKKADFHGCLEPVKVCETDPSRAKNAHEKALERALAFTSENPYFLVVLGPSYVQSHQLVISHRFARKHFESTLTKVDVSLCLPNGKSWPAEYHQQRTGNLNARICNGWRAFVNDNKLKVGDVCVLEMMNGTQISFKVYIFQAIADEDCHPSQGVSEQPLVSTSQTAKAPLIFRRVVLPLHLKKSFVDIPYIFVEQYMKPNIEKLVLQVADRSWPVEIKIYPRSRKAALTSGWIEFARGNSLSEGDICVCELDTVDSSLLKVSISKCAS